MEKSSLKKILATASAFAVIAGASTGARATGFESVATGGAVLSDDTAGDNNNVTNAGNVLAAGDSFKFLHDNVNMVSQGAAGIAGAGVTVDVNNKTGATWRADSDIVFGAVNATGGGTMALTVGDGITVTLGGAATGLGDITLGNGVGVGTLVVNSDTTFKGEIDSNGGAAANGVLTVNAGKTVIFEGAVGKTKGLATATLNGTNTFKSTLKATNITIGDASTTTVKANVTATAIELGAAANTAVFVVDGDATIAGTLDGYANNNGTLTVNAGKTVEFSGAVGNGADLLKANINGDTEFKGVLAANDIVVGDEATATVNGNVTGNIALNGANGSTLAIADTLTVAGTINSDVNKAGIVTVAAGKTATFNGVIGGANGANALAKMSIDGKAAFGASATMTNLTMGAAGAATIANGEILTISGASLQSGSTIDAVNAGNGTLEITKDSELSIAGKIGNTKGLSAITLASGSNVTFNETVEATTTTVTDATAVFEGTVTGGIATAGSAASSTSTITANEVTGNLDLTNGGTATASSAIGGTVTLNNGANVNASGAVGGGVTFAAKSDGLFVGDLTKTDVAGAVVINSSNAGTNTLHNVDNDVTLTAGNLTMNDVTGAGNHDVVVTAGTLVMNDAVHDVTLNGGTATINDIGNNLLMTANATATVKGDITGTTTTAASNKLTLEAGTSTGDVTNLGQIYITGNREFKNAMTTPGAMEAQGSGVDLTFSTADDGMDTIVLTTDQTDQKNDIIISTDQTLTAATKIGTSDNQFGNVVFSADKTLIIRTKEFHAGVTTQTTNTGTATFDTTAGLSARSLGTTSNLLSRVNFNVNTTITDGVHATRTDVGAATATIGGEVTGAAFNLANAASVVNFSDGVVVDAIVHNTEGNANKGAVSFAGDATISKEIGATNAVLSVTFADDATKTAKVGANITAQNIVLRKGTVQLTSDATFTGTTGITDGTLDLADKALTQTGNITINGDKVTIKSTLSTDANGNLTGGKVDFAANTLTVAADATVAVELDDTSVKRTKGFNKEFTLVTGTTGLTNNGQFTVSNITGNKFLAYTVAVDTTSAAKTVKVTATDNAKNYLAALFAGKYKSMTNVFADAAEGTDGAQMSSLLETLENANNSTKSEEALRRIKEGSVLASGTVASTMATVGNTLATRAMAVNSPIRTASVGKVAGVAAGDDAARFGAWASPFYSRVNQSERNGFAGYKNESYGLAVGLDTKVNEDLTLGVALTATNSNIKHKDLKSGDRTKVNSLLFSVYNMYNITDNWFASGSVTFATNDVENRSKRVSSTTAYEQADAKYSVSSFDLKQVFGYNYVMEEAVITPMVGLKYSRVNNTSYAESGTSFQNLEVSTKAFDMLEAIAGVKVAGTDYDMGGVSLTPEAHAFVNYNLFNKSQKQSISHNGSKLDSASDKGVRANYNLGLGVTSEVGAMEYGASYDFQFAEKKTGHQGALKVRVNF